MAAFTTADRDAWHWTLLIRQPPPVTAAMATDAIVTTAARRLTAGDRVRFDILDEGTTAQVVHRGPYRDEAPTIARLHRFVADHGLVEVGRHHEIYLSDPRRVAPERMRRIIRQPVGPR
ncbi:MAG TPA: GyrI-like domain-containing protein [Euzebyales bacterium]|nr:GyrI-like domain-containing protein [Euzebyales bacterium]